MTRRLTVSQRAAGIQADTDRAMRRADRARSQYDHQPITHHPAAPTHEENR